MEYVKVIIDTRIKNFMVIFNKAHGFGCGNLSYHGDGSEFGEHSINQVGHGRDHGYGCSNDAIKSRNRTDGSGHGLGHSHGHGGGNFTDF